MTGHTYKPIYEKIFKSYHNQHFNSLQDIKIPFNELEVLCTIQGNNIQFFKYLPLQAILKNWNNFLENVWCDYFLDGCTSGSIGLRYYGNKPNFKGYKALFNEKSIFVKYKSYDYSNFKNTEFSSFSSIGIVDFYIKIRRIKIKR